MKLYISKLDAAKRQLEVALRMFFYSGDPVSIHTLVNASYEILTQLCLKQGIKNIINEGTEKFIRKEKQKEVKTKLFEAKNFFKHSGKDPNQNIEFNPELNPFLLWDCCRLYKILTSEFTSIMLVFHVWFSLKNKDLVLDEKRKEILDKINYTNYLDLDNKEQFLVAMLPLTEQAVYKNLS